MGPLRTRRPLGQDSGRPDDGAAVTQQDDTDLDQRSDPEQQRPQQPEPGATASGSGTGHVVVNRVLRSLDDLDELPVARHGEVFLAADETMRAALADGQADVQT
jgi:hypothetical protein